MWLNPATVTPSRVAELKKACDEQYNVANAHGLLCKTAADTPKSVYGLAGRFVISQSGWGLLEVPNAIVNGLFDALQEPGVELPKGKSGRLNAHISVFRKEEVAKLGGPGKFKNDSGHFFSYQLGPVQSVEPVGWDEMSRVWFVKIHSPALEKLRRSYGLTSRPNDNKFNFHLTFACRAKHVLRENDVSKSAEALSAVQIESADSTVLKMQFEQGRVAENVQQLCIGIQTSKQGSYQRSTECQLPAVSPGTGPQETSSPVQDSRVSGLEKDAGTLSVSSLQSVSQLWRSRHQGLYKMARGLPGLLHGHGPTTLQQAFNRQEGHERRLHSGELPLGHCKRAESQSSYQPVVDPQCRDNDASSLGGEVIHSVDNHMQSLAIRLGHTKSADNAGAKAEGIPDRQDLGDMSKLQQGQLLDWIVQHHNARRAGEHYDVRFGNQDTGLYSWAARKGLPQPGQKHLAIQQPVHSHGYKDFEGDIPSGYGAGSVKKHQEGRVLVTKSQPGEVHLTTAHDRFPSRYMLKQTKDKNWLLMNHTPTEAIPYEKQHYKQLEPEEVEGTLANLQPGSSVQTKIDGAASLTKLRHKHFDVASYRAAKNTGNPIIHTERMFHGRPEVNIPKELRGTILRGELYGEGPGGTAIRPQKLGGLLNSGVGKSMETQNDQRTKLRQMIFDIEQLGKQKVSPDTPYAERRKMIDQVLPHLPQGYFHPPEEAHTPEAAQELWKRISSKGHPLTQEGVVIHPAQGKPMKAKLFGEHDVHIRETFPGQGKYEGKGAGGFKYSHEPEGPIMGEVGSGLSDDLRSQMHSDPAAFIGRVARVRAQEKFPSGALRAPSLLSLHEDYPAAKVAAAKASKTVAVDLDGTLAVNDGWKGEDHFGAVRPGAKATLKWLKDEGHRVIIWTCRGDKKKIKAWLDKNELPYDEINVNSEIKYKSPKIVANLYIDDRAVDARKSWTKIKEEVAERLGD